MHELGICDALLKMVDSVAKDEELECVKKVTVEVGTLSGVIPAYLSDCWTAVTDGTAYQDTRFVVETLTGTARCLDCGAEFTAELEQLPELRWREAHAAHRARPDAQGNRSVLVEQ